MYICKSIPPFEFLFRNKVIFKTQYGPSYCKRIFCEKVIKNSGYKNKSQRISHSKEIATVQLAQERFSINCVVFVLFFYVSTILILLLLRIVMFLFL